MSHAGKVSGGLPTKAPGIFYGWRVIGAASTLYVLASGIYWAGFSFYFLPVTRDLGISRTSMSLALGLARLVGGLQAPLMGYLVDRLGPRPMIVFGGFVGGVGLILLGLTQSYLTFLLVYLGLVVVGFSGGFDLGIMSLPNRWFIRQKARAMAVLIVGASSGYAFVAPAVGLVVVNVGWREAAVISGIALLAVLVPACLIIRNLPEDMGLAPDGQQIGLSPSSASGGESGTARHATRAPGLAQSSSQVDYTAGQAFRTVSFWYLALTMGLRVAAYAGLWVHFVPIVVWKGQSETTAALLMGIYGLSMVVMTSLIGWFADKFPRRRLISGGMLVGGLSMVILLLSSGQLWQLVIAVVLLTFVDGTGAAAWAFVGDLFGRRAFATLLGVMTLVYSLMSATTPVLAGWIFDSTGSYFGALIMVATLFIVGGIMFWNVPRPRLPATPA